MSCMHTGCVNEGSIEAGSAYLAYMRGQQQRGGHQHTPAGLRPPSGGSTAQHSTAVTTLSVNQRPWLQVVPSPYD